jgi:hypothetical protein
MSTRRILRILRNISEIVLELTRLTRRLAWLVLAFVMLCTAFSLLPIW